MQMMKNKQGKASANTMTKIATFSLAIIAICFGVVVVGGIVMWATGNSIPNPFSVAGTDDEGNNIITVNDGSGVVMTFNDKNALQFGTDPSLSMTIFKKDGESEVSTVADDATLSLSIGAKYDALIGFNGTASSSTYFPKEVSFTAGDQPFKVGQEASQSVFKAGAPTLSIVNKDAVTKNSDSNDEAMVADTSYKQCITASAPSFQSSSEYGVYVVFEYDATYISKIEPGLNLESASATIQLAHVTNQSGASVDFDQFRVMKFSQTLKNDADVKLCYTTTTMGVNPGEDQGNVLIHWLPISKDLNADNFNLITDIYDEDNNAIYLGNTTIYAYAS